MAEGLYYSEEAGRWTLLGYNLVIMIGGVIAWVKVKSRVSLISATLSSICLWVAFGISWSYPVIAFSIGAIIAVNLAINFALRVQATRKFMPAGLLLLLSSGVFIFLCILAARAPIDGLPPASKRQRTTTEVVEHLRSGRRYAARVLLRRRDMRPQGMMDGPSKL